MQYVDGPSLADAAKESGADRAARGGPDRAARAARAARRARRRGAAPGRQARQRTARPRRPGAAHRLRDRRDRGRLDHHPDRRNRRLHRLPGARAGTRRRSRARLRPLVARRDAVHGGGGRVAVPPHVAALHHAGRGGRGAAATPTRRGPAGPVIMALLRKDPADRPVGGRGRADAAGGDGGAPAAAPRRRTCRPSGADGGPRTPGPGPVTLPAPTTGHAATAPAPAVGRATRPPGPDAPAQRPPLRTGGARRRPRGRRRRRRGLRGHEVRGAATTDRRQRTHRHASRPGTAEPPGTVPGRAGRLARGGRPGGLQPARTGRLEAPDGRRPDRLHPGQRPPPHPDQQSTRRPTSRIRTCTCWTWRRASRSGCPSTSG